MTIIWCLLLVAAGCAAAPDRSEKNVFPPYKPLFSPEEWKELMELFNLTMIESPPLFEKPLTDEHIVQLVRENSTQQQAAIGRRDHAPEIDESARLVLGRGNTRQEHGLDRNLALEDLLLELQLQGLGYDEILAILGEYLKG